MFYQRNFAPNEGQYELQVPSSQKSPCVADRRLISGGIAAGIAVLVLSSKVIIMRLRAIAGRKEGNVNKWRGLGKRWPAIDSFLTHAQINKSPFN